MTKKVTYYQVGDNYSTKDPINKLSQVAAKKTAINLKRSGFNEVSDTRGESAFVWDQGNVLMASVVECLGTKSLIADQVYKNTGKSHYGSIAQDTVATIINDLSTVGAKPLVIHAYWAVEDNSWLHDQERMKDFIKGWEIACNLAGATWGGGETPTLKGILKENSVDLAGSAVGIIKNKKNLVTDTKLKEGDRIIFINSNGINANGISLARKISSLVKGGYSAKITSSLTYGSALLTKTHIYANTIQDILNAGVDIHYIANITGHGLRKIMRARKNFTYTIEKIFEPLDVFKFIQKHAGIDNREMYQTYNMGQDYAIFVSKKDVKKTLEMITKNKFLGLDAGMVEKGPRQLKIKPLNITYTSETLDLR